MKVGFDGRSGSIYIDIDDHLELTKKSDHKITDQLNTLHQIVIKC